MEHSAASPTVPAISEADDCTGQFLRIGTVDVLRGLALLSLRQGRAGAVAYRDRLGRTLVLAFDAISADEAYVHAILAAFAAGATAIRWADGTTTELRIE